MRKILYILLLLPLLAGAQIQNYIKTTTQRDSANIATQQVNVTYFDGLGRPTQKIQGKMGGDGKDIITHIAYDAFGRQVREYLPYVSTNGTAQAFDTIAYNNTMQYYTNALTVNVDETTSNPYSEKFLETSPVGRVLKQAAPGNAWVGNPDPYSNSDKTVKFDQMANSDADAVKKYSATTDASYVPTFTSSGVYVAGQLYKTITKDENWTSGSSNNTVEEFKNKEGQLILKVTYDAGVKHYTYYVYDQFGNLTYVLPPLVTSSITTAVLNDLCYQYKYDSRNRLVEKKLPGKQWEFIVYDLLDRPVLSGPVFSPFPDSPGSGWMMTIYDGYGRVAMTGWFPQATINSAGRNTKQIDPLYGSGVVKAVRGSGSNGGISTGYNAISSPPIGFKLLTVNYYDDYTWPGAPTFPIAVDSKNARTKLKGLLTGSWVRILDAIANTTGELSYTLYDYKCRPVRSRTANYLGGYTQVDTKFDFDGSPTKTVTTHKRITGSTPDITVEDNFAYTAQDRLASQTHKINSLTAQPLAGYTYNKLGQLKGKAQGTTLLGAWQNIGYKYNARGWLTDINDVDNLSTDLFAFKIAYNTVTDAPVGCVPLYNGNISETYWKTSTDSQKRKYSYKYDNLNRLKNAYYQKPGTAYVGSYDENISYDKNGNITSLSRNGAVDDFMTAVPIDDQLVYTYAANSNKLLKVYESGANASPQGFKDVHNPSADDYTYDANGNTLTDLNKGIVSTKYNHLNLPMEISFGGSNKIVYLYDAAGRKLKKTVTEVVSSVTTTVYVDYLAGGFQYKGGVLQFFPTAEGYVDNTVNSGGSNVYNYVFQYKDHLGNVRVSYGKDKNGNKYIMEENHYYPYGLKHLNYNMDLLTYQNIEDDIILYPPLSNDKLLNKYKYNGKELQDELGLNMYDYGARNYDPALGRWMNMDPLSEVSRRWSPYTYCYNNPVIFVDPDGMKVSYGEFIDDAGKPDYNWETGEYRSGSVENAMSLYGGGLTINPFGGGDPHEYSSKYGKQTSIEVGPIENTTEIDYSAYEWAAGSLVVLADDGIPPLIADDVAIPIAYVAATAVFAWDNRILLAKAAMEIGRILEKTLATPGFTYELIVNSSGTYTDVRGNLVSLNAGDVWKYGETTGNRYSGNDLRNMVPGGVTMVPIFFGNQVEIKVQEKIMIYGYAAVNGSLPPGNRIFR